MGAGQQGAATGHGLHSKALIREHVDAEISQRYDLDAEELGSGGYGRVFLATDRQARSRTVAIKKIVIFESDMRELFEKEVLIMKDLDHPNVCKVFESYDQGRTVFLVMEYCEGGELLERLLEQETIGEPASADIIGQVASALKYAHARGIAHRDMKPENICFCSKDPTNNHVKVIDWGVGKYFRLQRMRSSVGSFAYAAPEVLDSDGCYSASCDLWSLGVIAYIMLCGQPPFSGSCMQQLEQMKENPCPMDGLPWKSVSDDGKAFVRGLLQADPAQRLCIDGVLAHPWLKADAPALNEAVAQQILSNMRRFSATSSVFSLCAAMVARQLDHRRLEDMRQVFREMDQNGDGVLQLHEVRAGFERIFGDDSPQVRGVDEMFAQLDLDGSGAVDYTEFCAAGLGERMSTEVDALQAAFRAFDVHDGDGKVTKEELVQVLASADVGRIWNREAVEQTADEIFERFDSDGDGLLDFDEWLQLMTEQLPAGLHTSPKAGLRRRKQQMHGYEESEGQKILRREISLAATSTEADAHRTPSTSSCSPTESEESPAEATKITSPRPLLRRRSSLAAVADALAGAGSALPICGRWRGCGL